MSSRLLALAAALACAAPLPAQTLEEATDAYFAERYDESLPIFSALLEREPRSADLHAWVAENQVRLRDTPAALHHARAALEVDPCNAAAHRVIASVYVFEFYLDAPLDSLNTHARAAVRCAPDDGNAWLGYWMMGIMRRDSVAEALAQRRVAELGFIPEAVMEQGRWILRSAPPGAVLVTNGDWDYFPIRVAQTVEGLRPDVTVILRSFWEFPWYVRQIAGRTGYPLPPEVDSGLDEWYPADEVVGRLGAISGGLWAEATLRGARPLTVSATAVLDEVVEAAWPRWDGAVYTLRPWDEAPRDTAVRMNGEAFVASLRHLDVARLAGPVAHPTDRSPVRRNTVHPATFVAATLLYYGWQGLDDGKLDDVRQALVRLDEVIATGRVRADRVTEAGELRAALAEAERR